MRLVIDPITLISAFVINSLLHLLAKPFMIDLEKLCVNGNEAHF